MKGGITYIMGIGLTALVSFFAGVKYNQATHEELLIKQISRTIPPVMEVQEGYIAPGRLEILTDDNDSDGKPETYLQIDGRARYLLREVNGMPVISRYMVWHGSKPMGNAKWEMFPYKISIFDEKK